MSLKFSTFGALVCVLASVLLAAVAPSAGANPTLSFESSSSLATDSTASPDLLAGSHPYALTTSYKLRTTTNGKGELVAEGGDLKDLVTEFPPGVAVNPLAATRCGSQEFETVNLVTGEDGCPNSSAVGIVAVQYTTPLTPTTPDTAEVPLYNLMPGSGSPALFGAQVAGTPMYLSPSIRTGGDYGLTIALTDIPHGPVHVLGGTLTLWGVPADASHDQQRGDCVQSHGTCSARITSKPLIALPTQCTTSPIVVLRADSWEEPEAFSATASDPLLGGPSMLTACQTLDFSPTFHTQVESSATDSPTGMTLNLHLPQSEDPAGLVEAQLQDARVSLPAGMAINLSRASSVVSCPLDGPEGVNLSSAEPSHCPEASKIGGVKIATPLLGAELTGALYLAQQGNLAGDTSNPFGSLLAFYITAEGAGVQFKLPVEIAADAQTGRLSMHFAPDPTTNQPYAPQLPLEDIALEFDGGQRAVLATPPACGTQTTATSLTPWNGASPATPSDAFTLTENCGQGFNPSFAAGPLSPVAGAYSPLALTLARQDGEQEFKGLSTTLPVGMLAMAGSVPLCPEPQASLGTCDQASLIGEATVSVGVGPAPLEIKGGKVYFTGPYNGGPFGLSIVMPINAGPLNLGPEGRSIIVRAAIYVNRLTGQITMTTDPEGAFSIPTLIQGLAPQVRSINVIVNRTEFTFNSTTCAPQAIVGTTRSTLGATASLSTPFQTTDCSALPFGPKLTASTEGTPSKKNGIGLNVKIVEGYIHESNARYVKVELPKQLPSRLTTLQKACLSNVFETNPAACPPGSIVGTSTNVTSVLPVPMVGPAYLVSHGGAKFPELVLVLQGYGVTVEIHGETFIDKAGITSTTFPSVPEAPIPSAELRLPPGPGSILSAHGNLCGEDLHMITTIIAYNGLTVKESPQITVPGCEPTFKVLRHRVHGRLLTITVSAPSAGTLVATGKGLGRKLKRLSRAGTATIKLRLPKHSAQSHRHHHRHPRRVVVGLTFTPSSGSRLSARVIVTLR